MQQINTYINKRNEQKTERNEMKRNETNQIKTVSMNALPNPHPNPKCKKPPGTHTIQPKGSKCPRSAAPGSAEATAALPRPARSVPAEPSPHAQPPRPPHRPPCGRRLIPRSQPHHTRAGACCYRLDKDWPSRPHAMPNEPPCVIPIPAMKGNRVSRCRRRSLRRYASRIDCKSPFSMGPNNQDGAHQRVDERRERNGVDHVRCDLHTLRDRAGDDGHARGWGQKKQKIRSMGGA